jgi:uncharacterized Tic20 family protein
MEDQPLNSQIRRTATICHLLGLLWLPNAIGIFWVLELIWRVNSGGNLNSFSFSIFTVPMAGLLLSTLMTIIFWKINKRNHSFIRESGAKAINFICTCSLYLATSYTLMLIMVFLAFALANSGIDINPSIATVLVGQYLIFCPVILLAHFCLSIAGAILTWQGKIYSYPLSLRLFKETS